MKKTRIYMLKERKCKHFMFLYTIPLTMDIEYDPNRQAITYLVPDCMLCPTCSMYNLYLY